MRRTIAIAAILILGLSGATLAGNNPIAKVAVHVVPHGSPSCKALPSIASCEDIIETEASSNVDAYPVFYDMVEYKGIAYAMTWPGASSGAFTGCSEFTVGDIVWPGDGTSHTWGTCQVNTVVIPGYIWLFPTEGQICIIPHPHEFINSIQLGDCTPELDTIPPDRTFCAGVAGAVGDDPCQPATEAATWGAIKSLFR